MTLVVEDGSIVANANSLVTVAEYLAYATSLGITPTGNLEDELTTAMRFIDSQESALKGYRVDRDQALSYPRSDVYIESWYWRNDEIPRQARQAQMALALDIEAGMDLWNRPEPDNKVVKKERVEGVVDVEYAVKERGSKLSKDSISLALLSSLKRDNGLALVRA